MRLQQPPTGRGTLELETLGTYDEVPTHVDACPNCDSLVVDGQGLLGCVDCSWHGIVA
ncbi:MAG: hypothetical protein ABEJ31_03385 [Haloarculaceae archaeon]